jgi:MipA family protein
VTIDSMMKKQILYTLAACSVLCASAPALAQTTVDSTNAASQYKLELGFGAAVIRFPAYRGSNQSSFVALPFPYIDYRGDFFKADREGLRGSLFNSERVELSVSVSGSPPTKSEGIELRKGMPNLKPSLEFGPQLNIRLSDPNDKSVKLNLRLPLRQGISLESKPKNVGLTFSPNLNLDIPNPLGLSGANFGVVFGPIFTSKKQNDYFYTVDSAYATSTRPAYQAKGGYAGTALTVGLSRRVGNVWAATYARYDNLGGASFANSPLVATKNYVTAGVAVAYIFKQF